METKKTCEHVDSNVKMPPEKNPVIHKEECTQCFDNDASPTGVNVCLSCFNGGCCGSNAHDQQHARITGHSIVLNMRKVEIEELEVVGAPKVPTKLAIGVEGGVDAETGPKYEYHTRVFCLKCKCELDKTEGKVAASVAAVIAADAATKQQSSVWEEIVKPCDHTKNLVQKADAEKLQAQGLVNCQQCSLKAADGLWLCMTCGALGCARKQPDGSGGNGHALAHYNETKHPVSLKVGTITSEGKADIFCYICDEMRVDESLAKHLNHFGIQLADQEKTVKSMEELNLEQNLKIGTWSRVLEEGKEQELLYGPGHTGLANLGNSCYMASAMQVVFSLPRFIARYWVEGKEHIKSCRQWRPADCFQCQMAKLASGMMSGDYSKPPTAEQLKAFQAKSQLAASDNKAGMDVSGDGKSGTKTETKEKEEKGLTGKKRKEPQPGIPPRLFKKLICKSHQEFTSSRQQDALEFLQYFFQQVQQAERSQGIDPTECFAFKTEDRLECQQCHRVRYTTQKTTELSLPIPYVPKPKEEVKKDLAKELEKDKAQKDGKDTKKDEKETEEPPVAFDKCLGEWAATQHLENYNCPVCKTKTKAIKYQRLETFPDVLMVHMRRFVHDNWVPTKLTMDVTVDKEISLEPYRGKGLQKGEEEMPKAGAGAQPKANDAIVEALVGMGFGKNRCIRAALATDNTDVDAAMNWLLTKMEDASLDLPLEAPKSDAPSDMPPAEAIAQLEPMGFPKDKCIYALRQTKNDVARAIDWLFSHADDPLPSEKPDAKSDGKTADSKPARFRLAAFITHMGRSTGSGHYVAHVLKEGRWVIFNDSKVAVSSNPPMGQAYIYFFRRY